MRPQCSVFIAASLDGFIARRDGNIDWLSIVERPNEDYGFKRFFDTVDALVIGRKTWETAKGFEPWPYAGKRVVVLTHRELEAKHDEERYEGKPEPLVEKLGAEGVKRVYVDGGNVIRQFLAANLISDLTLSIIPILLSEGEPLFGKLGHDVPLKLRDAQKFESGLVQLHYDVTTT